MRKTALRKLEILETEERAYQQRHQSSLATTAFLCWKVVFAHNLGDLKPDDEDPGEAAARALGYETPVRVFGRVIRAGNSRASISALRMPVAVFLRSWA